MVNISANSKKIDIILPNTNRALAEVLQNASSKELQTLSQNKDLKSILNSLLVRSSQNSTSNKALLDLLKTNPTLKALGSSTENIQGLLSTIKSEKKPLLIEKTLQKFLTNIQDIKQSPLKQKFENSGVFLESKLKYSNSQNIKEIIANDLKSALLITAEELKSSLNPNRIEILKQIDKLLLQIDYHQLLSHLSNASSLFIPFSWEDLQEGQIELKKDKNNRFYCDIDLKLKKYGELNIKLALYEKNQLNVHIYSDHAVFKEIIKENLGSLRLALGENKIRAREIRVLNLKKPQSASVYESSSTNIDIGFKVKV